MGSVTRNPCGMTRLCVFPEVPACRWCTETHAGTHINKNKQANLPHGESWCWQYDSLQTSWVLLFYALTGLSFAHWKDSLEFKCNYTAKWNLINWEVFRAASCSLQLGLFRHRYGRVNDLAKAGKHFKVKLLSYN